MNVKVKLFFIIVVAAFVVQSVMPQELQIPLYPEKDTKESVFTQVILPLLQKQKNSYSLIKERNGIIPQAEASQVTSSAADYEAAQAYALIDFETGKVILEKNLSDKMPIASLTKIMTAVVALDLMETNEFITITENAASQIPTKIGVVTGQRMSVNELLHATLLTSANDAAEAVKDGIDQKYGEKVFIRAMNEKARIIGLKSTSFTNPQGFDNRNNYSTTEDLAILSHYALTHYPFISEIVAKDYAFLPEDNNHKQFDLYNWNGLIGVYPNTTGIKIGSTGRAGKTTVVVSERGGKKLLAVVLNAPGIFERDLWAADLLDTGFEEVGNLPRVSLSKARLQEKYNTWK